MTPRMPSLPRAAAVVALSAVLALACLPIEGCNTAECAYGQYNASACRVAAENHFARALTSTGVEVRFQSPGSTDATSWEALGLVEEQDAGVVRLRPATLMDFAVSFEPLEGGAVELSVILDNVAADTVVSAGPDGSETELPGSGVGISRAVQIPLTDGVTWLRGERACPDDYRLFAAGDIQTGPIQFERIVQSLHAEEERGESDGRPVLGVLLLGDLAEEPVEEELRRVDAILGTSPVPFAVVPGNHDVNGDEFALFNRVFGPGNYAFDACRTRVVMLDTGGADLAPTVEAEMAQMVDPGESDFLIAGTHYPPYPGRTGNGMRDEAAGWHLLSELVRNGGDLMLTGHYHYWVEHEEVRVGDGTIHQIISGTAGGVQGAGIPHYGLTRMDFVGQQLETCLYEVEPAGRPEGDHRAGDGHPIRFCDD